MKKLKLKSEQLNNAQVLTRGQLRNVLGGGGTETTMPGGGGETTVGSCTESCPDGLQTCTSDKNSCSRTKDAREIVISITCDGTTFNC